MRPFGLEELLATGLSAGTHPNLLKDFWGFGNMALTVSVLQAVERVVRKHFLRATFTGLDKPLKDTALVAHATKKNDSLILLWSLFLRLLQSTLALFEANMDSDFNMHAEAIRYILRCCIHSFAAEEEICINKAGYLDVLVPYQLLINTPGSR